jgi:hypothetical protein
LSSVSRHAAPLRNDAEVVLQVLTALGSYDLATAPDLLDLLLIHEVGSLTDATSGDPISTLVLRSHEEPTDGRCTAHYAEYVLPDGTVLWRTLRSFSMDLPRGADDSAV